MSNSSMSGKIWLVATLFDALFCTAAWFKNDALNTSLGELLSGITRLARSPSSVFSELNYRMTRRELTASIMHCFRFSGFASMLAISSLENTSLELNKKLCC